MLIGFVFFFFRKDLQDDLWVKLFVSRAWGDVEL